MNKVHRKRTEISVAFSSGLKYLCSKEPDINSASINEANSQIMGNKGVLRIKKLMRQVLRPLYRNLKQVLRPITFRLRRYLTADLNQQNLQLLHMMQVILSDRDSLREEIHQTSIASFERIQQMVVVKLQQERQILLDIAQQFAVTLHPFQEACEVILRQIQQTSRATLKENEQNIPSQLIKEKTDFAYLDHKIQDLQTQIENFKTILASVEKYNLTMAHKNSTVWEKTAV